MSTPSPQIPPRRRTSDLVYVHLRDQIATGELAAGTRLDLDDVATTLNVSRTPVREAVQRLEGDGFLRRDPYRAVTVTPVDEAYVDEIVALRVHNEGLASLLGCLRLSPENLDQMDLILAQLDDVDHADHAEFAHLNEQFHGILYRASDAPRLLSIVETLSRHAERIRLHYQIARNVHVAEQHREILTACVQRDSEGAHRAMRHHILGVLIEMARLPSLELSLDHLQCLGAVLEESELKELRAGLQGSSELRGV